MCWRLLILSKCCPVPTSAPSPSQALAPGVSVIKVCQGGSAGQAMVPEPVLLDTSKDATLRTGRYGGLLMTQGVFVLVLLPYPIIHYHELG